MRKAVCRGLILFIKFAPSCTLKQRSCRLGIEKYKMFLENTVNHKEQFGWIEVICGSMFSGKTEELIRRLKRANLQNKR